MGANIRADKKKRAAGVAKPKSKKSPPRLPVQQLIILSICRFAEPLAMTSVFPYLPEMIQSFNVPKNKIAKWAGITSAVFSLSQCLTGIAWGRASDRFGRKRIIMLGLFLTMINGLIFGFAQSLPWAIIARAFQGLSNGNVGILRTTVAEMVPERELQPRAFSIMPLVWSIGSIFGPAFGGALADPAARHPKLFGNSKFFKKFPYALPNMVNACFFLVGLVVGILFLRETLETRKHQRDYGLVLGQALLRPFRRDQRLKHRQHGKGDDNEDDDERAILIPSQNEDDPRAKQAATRPLTPQKPPGYGEVFSPQSNINLAAYSMLALHSVAFDQLLPIFMHHPAAEFNEDVQLPFKFSGGFGINSERIGVLFTIYGLFGMVTQFTIFPPVARRLGILKCFKICAFVYPFIYLVVPFTALLPTAAAKQGVIIPIMLIKCLCGMFAFPCSTIMLTNSATSLRILGTLNGVATSVSAVGRAVGPAIGGSTFTLGVEWGYVILPWWVLAFLSILAAVPVLYLQEMKGFAKDDDDDDDDDDEDDASETDTGLLEEEAEDDVTAQSTQPGASLNQNDAKPDTYNSTWTPSSPSTTKKTKTKKNDRQGRKNRRDRDNAILDGEEDLSSSSSSSLSSSSSSSSDNESRENAPLLGAKRPLNKKKSGHNHRHHRVSSPIGLRDALGPHGSRRLSDNLGPTNNGYGAGGTSWH
ncbi:MFS general substrate transporter [Xylona heveae TC161]|uniref:MFS general substrate transporter n=1 Tax=Xylona heveae (strain CBS 132557 / TC161) TaxID=1328760 RepID=A0A165I603_XYLHT|nr:MFS general substrate transporter [Xylona heveae TC161]KZF24434.1 MFS general substrate transporter [Xylona heveae TC161]